MSGCESKQETFMIKFDKSILLPEIVPCEFLTERKGVSVSMLRLDEVHPIVSGNKVFKLQYYIDEAMKSHHKTLLTFGGAFSNHLAATAYTCHRLGIHAIGVVRGYAHEMNSPTLTACREMGMELIFADRTTYREYAESEQKDVASLYPGDCTVVPMGGYSIKGAQGAAGIYNYISAEHFSHVCVSVGTGTTLAGLLRNNPEETIIGFPALKGLNEIFDRMKQLNTGNTSQLAIMSQFHFGGFARRSDELFRFMNWFYAQFRVPLDFVYTGKMMYGVFQLIEEGYFPPGARLVAIHTGGLQGNRSLRAGALSY